MKVIPGMLQHALVIADIDKKNIRITERKTHIEARKISLVKDVKVRKPLLHADDIILMSETIEGLRNKFVKWKEALRARV